MARSPQGEDAPTVTTQRNPKLKSRLPGGLGARWDDSRRLGAPWLNDAPRTTRSFRSALNQSLHDAKMPVKIDGYTDGAKFTVKVGSYTANRLGIYDLGGNVWE